MAASASAPVLLGLRDAAAPPRSASCRRGSPPPPHGLASQLGGSPDRFPAVALVRPACGLCSADLMHVVQIYCPLEGSLFHRVINLFACAKKSCWGKAESWKALRSQYLQAGGKETQDCELKQRQECVMETKDWCEGAEDWGEDREVAPSESKTGLSRDLHPPSALLPREVDCASQFQGLSLQEAPGILHPLRSRKPAGEEHVLPSCDLEFQAYYISVVAEEDYLGCSDTDHVQKLLKEYQRREGVDWEELMSESYTAGSCDEKYEKSAAEKRDQVFHKFMKRISACPGQILRYSWGGQPLFITCPSLDVKTAVPLCNNCKSKRIFEFQLMPALVSMLKSGDGDVSVEFGTAVVYTCEKSCWPVDHPTPLEEFIFIQEDPDQQLFK